MQTVIKSIATCACLLVSASAQELAPELAPLAQAHKTATAALAERRTEELARLRQPYLAALDDADQAATKAGDAVTLRAIAQERDAVNDGKMRAELLKALPRKLSSIHRALVSAEPRTHADFDKRQKAVDADYLQKLSVLQLKAARNPALAGQIAQEKTRVISGISGAITDLKSGLAGTKWRIFEGQGTEVLKFSGDGKVNGTWIYEATARDKVKVNFNKNSAMTLTLGKNGASLSDGNRIWALDRN